MKTRKATGKPPVRTQSRPDPTAFAFDLRDAALLTGVSVTSLRRAIRDKQLEATRVGQRIIIPRENLNRFVQQGWKPQAA
jgi:excisionase family DNA binding protein